MRRACNRSTSPPASTVRTTGSGTRCGGYGGGQYNYAISGSWWQAPDTKDSPTHGRTGLGHSLARENGGKYIDIHNYRIFYCPEQARDISESRWDWEDDWWYNNRYGGGQSGYYAFNGNGREMPAYDHEHFAGKATDNPELVIMADRAQWNGTLKQWDMGTWRSQPWTSHMGANILFSGGHVVYRRFRSLDSKDGFYMLGDWRKPVVAGFQD